MLKNMIIAWIEADSSTRVGERNVRRASDGFFTRYHSRRASREIRLRLLLPQLPVRSNGGIHRLSYPFHLVWPRLSLGLLLCPEYNHHSRTIPIARSETPSSSVKKGNLVAKPLEGRNQRSRLSPYLKVEAEIHREEIVLLDQPTPPIVSKPRGNQWMDRNIRKERLIASLSSRVPFIETTETRDGWSVTINENKTTTPGGGNPQSRQGRRKRPSLFQHIRAAKPCS